MNDPINDLIEQLAALNRRIQNAAFVTLYADTEREREVYRHLNESLLLKRRELLGTLKVKIAEELEDV